MAYTHYKELIMSKALNNRIGNAFGKIYDQGDAGLDYMDRHQAIDHALMELFYNDQVETLSKADKTKMADMLEACVADMQQDLEIL
jgi:hypothetical protein